MNLEYSRIALRQFTHSVEIKREILKLMITQTGAILLLFYLLGGTLIIVILWIHN